MGVSVKRIVVTGMGIVSPLGCGVQHVWQSLLAGKSGITRLSEQLVADIPAKWPARCRPLTAIRCTASTRWRPSRRRAQKMDRFIEFALVAAREALAQAGWSPVSEAEQERTATVIATGIGGFSEIANAVHTTDERGPRRLSPFTIPLFWPTWPPGMCLSPTVSGGPSAHRSPPARQAPRPSAMRRG